MDTIEIVVKVGNPGGTYPNPPCGYVIRPELLMADSDAKCGFRGDAIIATLSANFKA